MIKKIFKTLTISLPLLVSGNVFAKEQKGALNIEIYNYAQVSDISKLDNAANNLLFLSNYPFAIDAISNIDLKININDEAKESTSNYDRKNCKIEINYTKDLKPFIYSSLDLDLMMATLHEIGHCVLGKEILHKAPNWHPDLQLSQSETSLLWERIQKKKQKAFENLKEDRDCSEHKKCTPQEVFNMFPPMLGYHEIFADLWAITKYAEITCAGAKENMKTLENFRIQNFLSNPHHLHQSFLATYYLHDNWQCGKKFDFKELTFYTQKGFIDYLSNQ